MRVAFFFGGLNRGGAESLVLDVCKKKSIAPFEIVCLYRKDGDYLDSFKETGVDLLKVEQDGKNPFRFLASFRKAILSNKIDIVHAQTGFNALICMIALTFTHVKLITTFHGLDFASAPWWKRKPVYQKSKSIICVSGYEKQYYQDKWKLPDDNKLNVVYNGVDFSKLDIPVPKDNSPVCLNKDCLNMMMVGSFRSIRAHYFLCKVADALNKRGFLFHLYFVGRRDSLEFRYYDCCIDYCNTHNLNEYVHFMGNRSDIPFLLKQMDLFLYASNRDTFGIAVLEAMASGLPVLVNDWAVMKEITNNGELATLFETNNIDDCVSKILAFKKMKEQDPENLEQDCQRISLAVRERYSIEKHIQNLYNIYSSC